MARILPPSCCHSCRACQLLTLMPLVVPALAQNSSPSHGCACSDSISNISPVNNGCALYSSSSLVETCIQKPSQALLLHHTRCLLLDYHCRLSSFDCRDTCDKCQGNVDRDTFLDMCKPMMRKAGGRIERFRMIQIHIGRMWHQGVVQGVAEKSRYLQILFGLTLRLLKAGEGGSHLPDMQAGRKKKARSFKGYSHKHARRLQNFVAIYIYRD